MCSLRSTCREVMRLFQSHSSCRRGIWACCRGSSETMQLPPRFSNFRLQRAGPATVAGRLGRSFQSAWGQEYAARGTGCERCPKARRPPAAPPRSASCTLPTITITQIPFLLRFQVGNQRPQIYSPALHPRTHSHLRTQLHQYNIPPSATRITHQPINSPSHPPPDSPSDPPPPLPSLPAQIHKHFLFPGQITEE